MSDKQWWISVQQDTWAFSRLTSQLVNVSALPITGTMFTCACSCLISWTSIGRRLPTTQQISNDHRVDSANFTFTSYNVWKLHLFFMLALVGVYQQSVNPSNLYSAKNLQEIWSVGAQWPYVKSRIRDMRRVLRQWYDVWLTQLVVGLA